MMFRNGLKVNIHGNILRIFKSIIGLCIGIGIILGACQIANAQQITEVSEDCVSIPKEYKDKITFIHKDKLVGVMTIDQFRELTKSAERDQAIITAEEKGNVEITLEDDPWDIEEGQDFKTKAYIKWYGNNRQLLKSMTIGINLQRDREGHSWTVGFLRIYDRVARYGFPAALIVIILLIVLGGSGG
jgi:hypothetical protein